MAKLEYEFPIKNVKGKLKDNFGAAKRKLANAEGEQYPFSIFYGKRTTEASQDEVSHWNRFGAIAKLVAIRRKTVSKRIADIQAFKAQSTYKTFTSYLWSICTAEYEASLTA